MVSAVLFFIPILAACSNACFLPNSTGNESNNAMSLGNEGAVDFDIRFNRLTEFTKNTSSISLIPLI